MANTGALRRSRTVMLTFATTSWQKGSAAQVSTLVRELRALRPDLRFTLLSHCPELDRQPAEALGIALVGHDFDTVRHPKLRSAVMLTSRVRSLLGPFSGGVDAVGAAYEDADLVIDLSGDSYRDRPGGFALAHHANLLAAFAASRPMAVVSQSVGPFNRLSRRLVRPVVGRARWVWVRDECSFATLARLGVSADILHRAPDLAFSLPGGDPAAALKREGINGSELPRPWFGLSVSALSDRLGHGRYLDEMARLCRHLVATHGGSVIAVPHEVMPPAFGVDDRRTATRLRHRLGQPRWFHVLREDHDPTSLKGVLGACDLVVASRMHAAIAALSSGVPTIAVAWAPKYAGLMAPMGLTEYVWDQHHDPEALLHRRADSLWARRTSVRAALLDYRIAADQAVRSAVWHLAGLLPAAVE